jgi:hypothetical protein
MITPRLGHVLTLIALPPVVPTGWSLGGNVYPTPTSYSPTTGAGRVGGPPPPPPQSNAFPGFAYYHASKLTEVDLYTTQLKKHLIVQCFYFFLRGIFFTTN